jgi:hypothetical protein
LAMLCLLRLLGLLFAFGCFHTLLFPRNAPTIAAALFFCHLDHHLSV